jgi:hypothetical protein
VWLSLLKKQTASEKEKAEVRQKRLDVMEIQYSRRQAMADKLDAPNIEAAARCQGDVRLQLRLVPMPPSSSRRTSTHKQQSWLNGSRQWQSSS